MAEFSLVTVLVVTLFIGVVQLGLALHVRNTLLHCAVEGARYGARADVDPAQGAARARELVRGFASERYAQDVRAGTSSAGGVEVVEVTVRSPLPVVGTLGPGRALTVVGRAYREGQGAP